jgi:hypothetical protein
MSSDVPEVRSVKLLHCWAAVKGAAGAPERGNALYGYQT